MIVELEGSVRVVQSIQSASFADVREKMQQYAEFAAIASVNCVSFNFCSDFETLATGVIEHCHAVEPKLVDNILFARLVYFTRGTHRDDNALEVSIIIVICSTLFFNCFVSYEHSAFLFVSYFECTDCACCGEPQFHWTSSHTECP